MTKIETLWLAKTMKLLLESGQTEGAIEILGDIITALELESEGKKGE